MVNKEVVVFVLVLALIVVAIVEFAFIKSIIGSYLLVLIGLIILIASLKLLEIKEYQRAVIFRFGSFSRVAEPSWQILIRGIDHYKMVDMRTETVDVKPQNVITQDKIKLNVDAVVFIRVVDPKKAVLEVKDYEKAVENFMVSKIREAAGNMELNEILEKTDQINEEIKMELTHIAMEWGVTCIDVELKDIELPKGLVEAMHQQKEALHYKKKVETEAEARRIAIETVDKATTNLSDRTLAYLYMDTLKKMSQGKSSKIIFPLEFTSLAKLIMEKLGPSLELQKNGSEIDYERLAKTIIEEYKKDEDKTMKLLTEAIKEEKRKEEAKRPEPRLEKGNIKESAKKKVKK